MVISTDSASVSEKGSSGRMAERIPLMGESTVFTDTEQDGGERNGQWLHPLDPQMSRNYRDLYPNPISIVWLAVYLIPIVF